MGEEKNNNTSQKKSMLQRPWFWPLIYTSIAVLMLVAMFTYNALTQDEVVNEDANGQQEEVIAVESNVREETMKYPFKEEKLNTLTVLQEFYDMSADVSTRENALLVFNQTFTTSSGMSLSISNEPFEVLAAMSGEVTEVKFDAFTGNRISILHANGLITRYSSIGDILVQEGDIIKQGEQIATAVENESNPQAGIHLHFEVMQGDKAVNPRTLLGF